MDTGISALWLRDFVEFHAEESQISLPRFVNEGRIFDLAFVYIDF